MDRSFTFIDFLQQLGCVAPRALVGALVRGAYARRLPMAAAAAVAAVATVALLRLAAAAARAVAMLQRRRRRARRGRQRARARRRSVPLLLALLMRLPLLRRRRLRSSRWQRAVWHHAALRVAAPVPTALLGDLDRLRRGERVPGAGRPRLRKRGQLVELRLGR